MPEENCGSESSFYAVRKARLGRFAATVKLRLTSRSSRENYSGASDNARSYSNQSHVERNLPQKALMWIVLGHLCMFSADLLKILRLAELRDRISSTRFTHVHMRVFVCLFLLKMGLFDVVCCGINEEVGDVSALSTLSTQCRLCWKIATALYRPISRPVRTPKGREKRRDGRFANPAHMEVSAVFSVVLGRILYRQHADDELALMKKCLG